MTEVATDPKEVVAPLELISTLLVTPLLTVTEVVNPAGTPVVVMVVFERDEKEDVVGTAAVDDLIDDVMVEPVLEEDEDKTPTQDPETQVLNAH